MFTQAGDHRLKAQLREAIVLTQVEIEVLAGHVVLLGVVHDPGAIAAADAAVRSVEGVAGATNFRAAWRAVGIHRCLPDLQ